MKNHNLTSKDIQYHYNKTKEDIDKRGHSIKGTVDGKEHLERPFAYTIGASYTTGFEYISFFPVKGEGLAVVAKVMNKIISLVKNNKFKISSQIINDKRIYDLPLILFVLDEYQKEMVESHWVKQLERGGFLSEFSKDDHQLVLLIFSDKEGKLPWSPECGSFWPDMCPLPFLASAELKITGKDNLLRKCENELGSN